MRKIQSVQALAAMALAALSFTAVSAFAEQRPDSKTNAAQGELRVGGTPEELRTWGDRGERELVGTVISVARDGDDFSMRTRRGDVVDVEARGGVTVWYRGRQYGVRDLERGDRVSVDVASWGRRPRARSVQVIESVSDGGYGRGRDRDRVSVIEGKISDLDLRRNVMRLQTRQGEYLVDLSKVGRRAERLRVGDWVELEGQGSGRRFFADRILERDRNSYPGPWRRQ